MMTAALLLALAAASPASAQIPADYARGDSWLCHPTLNREGCETDQSTTRVAADGTLTPERWAPESRPNMDCFYVYPTISRDQTLNSDMIAGPEERLIFATQAARYRSVCRMFAPVYRQQTLAALRAVLTGGAGGDQELGYADVLAAWKAYMAQDNRGRGVILIGHSQGSRVLQRLIAEEIDGKAVQSRLVAAHLIGFPLAVPVGKYVGGAFRSTPLCTTDRQSGCVISFSMFRAGTVPSPSARFGRVSQAEHEAACTNPAALAGGKGSLDSVMPTRGMALPSRSAPRPWLTAGENISSAFVVTPGLLTAQCVRHDGASFLELMVNADSGDPRTDGIDGDVAFGGQILPDWGLHAVETSIALGSLVELARLQAATWRRADGH